MSNTICCTQEIPELVGLPYGITVWRLELETGYWFNQLLGWQFRDRNDCELFFLNASSTYFRISSEEALEHCHHWYVLHQIGARYNPNPTEPDGEPDWDGVDWDEVDPFDEWLD